MLPTRQKTYICLCHAQIQFDEACAHEFHRWAGSPDWWQMRWVWELRLTCVSACGFLNWPWSVLEEMYGFTLVILTRQKQCDPDYSCPCNWWIGVLLPLLLGGVAYNNSRRAEPNHSTEVQALLEASIMFVTAKSQEQSSGMSDGHRKRPRWQKLLGEFFGVRDIKRIIQVLLSSPVAIMRKVVEPKEKGRQRTSDWCGICMEEYGFMSINEIIGEKCCGKKTAKSWLCWGIYTLWRKRRKREVNVKVGQARRAWWGTWNPCIMYPQRRKQKKSWHDNDRGLGGMPPQLILFSNTPSYGGQRAHGLKECVKSIAMLCVLQNLPLHLREQPGFTAFMRTVDPSYP